MSSPFKRVRSDLFHISELTYVNDVTYIMHEPQD